MKLFIILTMVFVVASVVMTLIILVQRPQGGGLASAFGGAGGGGTETVFGGRVGDALTWATVIAFSVYLGLAISLNKIDTGGAPAVGNNAAVTGAPGDGTTPADDGTTPVTPIEDSE